MINVWLIARREFKQYFVSMIAYAIAFMILLILGILFYATIMNASYQGSTPDIKVVIEWFVIISLFAMPAITMRSLAEERRTGTLELLLSAPVRDWELVVGKWLGGILFMLTIILVTWIYPLILNQLIKPGIDQGQLLAIYLGVFLITSAWIAIGVAVSSLFSNQIASYFTTLGILVILFWLIGFPANYMAGAGGEIVRNLDFSQHFYNFFQGIVQLKDVFFFVSITALGLFFGTVSVEVRRWQ